MSEGSISAVAKSDGGIKCKLGEVITIKGDNVKVGIFNGWKYMIKIGSGSGEDIIRETISGKDLKEGFEFTPDEKYIHHASPYGDGRMCYIRAIGTNGEETREYKTFITLWGNLLPEFDLSVEIINSEVDAFGSHAVKGFSKVKATITPVEKKIGETVVSKLVAAQFTGGVFSKTFGYDAPEYSVEINPIETSGEVFVFANVMTEYGYQASENISFNVFNYNKPKLNFTEKPVRKDENGNEVIKVNSENKNKKFSLSFKGVITPCDMTDENGDRICTITEIKDTAIIKRIDGGEADILMTVKNVGDDGEREFEYSGLPDFGDSVGKGLETYKAYNLVIECSDTTGKDYKIIKRISTLGTAFHLKRGGNGASFGKYCENEQLVDSAWTVHSDEDVVAEKDICGATVTVKEGIRFRNEDEVTHDENYYYGVGTKENNIAKGNHTHGYITSDGRFFDEAGNALKSMILITDEEGRIIGTQKLSTNELAMAKEEQSIDAILGMKPSAKVASVGTPEAGLCYSNHIHPYSTEWKNDDDYKALREEISALYLTAQRLSS